MKEGTFSGGAAMAACDATVASLLLSEDVTDQK